MPAHLRAQRENTGLGPSLERAISFSPQPARVVRRGRQQRPWRRSDVARIAFQILSLCQREADTYEGKKPRSVCSRSPLFRWHRAATLHMCGKASLGTGLKKQGSYSGSEFLTDASTDTDGPRASREACLLLVACGAVGALLCPTGQDRLPAARCPHLG